MRHRYRWRLLSKPAAWGDPPGAAERYGEWQVCYRRLEELEEDRHRGASVAPLEEEDRLEDLEGCHRPLEEEDRHRGASVCHRPLEEEEDRLVEEEDRLVED